MGYMAMQPALKDAGDEVKPWAPSKSHCARSLRLPFVRDPQKGACLPADCGIKGGNLEIHRAEMQEPAITTAGYRLRYHPNNLTFCSDAGHASTHIAVTVECLVLMFPAPLLDSGPGPERGSRRARVVQADLQSHRADCSG